MKAIDFMTDKNVKGAVNLLKHTTKFYLGLFVKNEPVKTDEVKDTSFYYAGNYHFGLILSRTYFEIILKELLKIGWFRDMVPFNMESFFTDFVKIDKFAKDDNQEALFNDDANKNRKTALNFFKVETTKLVNSRHLEEMSDGPSFDDIICYFSRIDTEVSVAIINDYVRFCISVFSNLDDEDIEFRQAKHGELGHIIVNERVLLKPTFKKDEK